MAGATTAREIRAGATAAVSLLLERYRGDRKSRQLEQMTSCGMVMPWECVDYSNSLNKHKPINHSPTLSNPARGRAAHFLFCHGENVGVHSCVCVPAWRCMHAYVLAHAMYVYLYVHAFISPFLLMYHQKL